MYLYELSALAWDKNVHLVEIMRPYSWNTDIVDPIYAGLDTKTSWKLLETKRPLKYFHIPFIIIVYLILMFLWMMDIQKKNIKW